MRAGIELHDGGRLLGRPGGEHDEVGGGVQARDLGVRCLNDLELLRLDIQTGQVPYALLGVAAEDVTGGDEGIGGHAEDPLRSAEFGVSRA